MVASPSAAAQVTEHDKKRKTQHTMEKVKANHLTRQLQMRLQYARLKVEHGWNLNEVENLYFHNSHILRSNTKPSSSTQPIISSTPLLHPENPQDLIQAIQAVVARAAVSTTSPDPFQQDHPMNLDNSAPTIPQLLSHIPSPSTPTTISAPQPHPFLSPNSPTPTPNKPNILPPPSSASPSPPSPSSTNHYPPLKLPRTRTNKHPAGPKGTHQNLTAREMLDFASTSTLTYDDFWSSHSTASASAPANARSAVTVSPSSAAIATNLAPAFQSSALFTNGLGSIDLSQFLNSSFSPTPTTVDHSRGIGP